MSNVVQEYFNNRTPEVEALYAAFKRGEVDIFGNRKDAPGYSLASSVKNPNLTDTSVIGQAPTQTTNTNTSTNARVDTGAGGGTQSSNILSAADVENLYETYLNRPSDPGGLNFYTGKDRRETIDAFLNSQEYQLNEKFKDVFKRPMSIDDRNFYIGNINAGSDLATEFERISNAGMELGFIDKDQEFIDTFGTPRGTGGGTGGGTGVGSGAPAATKEGIRGLYNRILFREADDVGLGSFKGQTLSQVEEALRTSPEGLGPARIRSIYQGVLGRDATPAEIAYYSTIGGIKDARFDYGKDFGSPIEGPVFGGVVSSAERQKLIDSLRGDQLQRFETRLGLPVTTPSGPIQPRDPLDFSSFGATPATAGIARLKPTDTTGTMAGVFASPQFPAPDYSQFQKELESQRFGSLYPAYEDQFGEQFKADLIAEAAEEAEGKREGGLASLGYRRGGVVDENGIPRLFIGGLFKGIGRALSGAFKGITKIAPFVLPFIPGFQALTPFKQAVLAGGIGGFRDGKFDPTRALTAGVTSYGLGKLADAAGASGKISEGMGGVADPSRLSYQPGAFTSTAGAPAVNSYSPFDTSTAGAPSSRVGLDSLKGQVVGTGQNILKTGQELVSGNIPMKKLVTPAISTLGGITATKAGDEYAKQQAEYKALAAADAEERKRKRDFALEIMRRNPFRYNEGGETSLPPRYLDGAGDGMSDSIRANIGGLQEARLADGEFVVPADVVADLGNGSSNAGAERLYSMMDRIRQARHGTTKQPPEVNVNKALPA